MQLIYRSDVILFVNTLQYPVKEDTSCLCACCNTDPPKKFKYVLNYVTDNYK